MCLLIWNLNYSSEPVFNLAILLLLLQNSWKRWEKSTRTRRSWGATSTSGPQPRWPLRRCRRSDKWRGSWRKHPKPTSREWRTSTDTWTCSRSTMTFLKSAGTRSRPTQEMECCPGEAGSRVGVISGAFGNILLHTSFRVFCWARAYHSNGLLFWNCI